MRYILVKYGIMASLIFLASKAEGQRYAQTSEFQLSSPKISSSTIYFINQTDIEIDLDIDGVVIHYTTDGSIPTKESDIYKSKISIDQSVQIKAKAWHEDFQPSIVVELSVFKLNPNSTIKLEVSPDPSESYPGKGISGLTNQIKGSADFRDGHWLGFSADTIEMKVELEKRMDIPKVYLSLLEDQRSWIFVPVSVEAWLGNEQVTLWEKDRLQNELKSFQYIQLTIPRKNVKEVTIKIMMNRIPDWHLGTGSIPWFFVDEVFIQK
ncbi:chitobiase/beta-hexosaminidase C-terminal domain-containing protein [Ekhidna sp.]